MRKSVIYCIVNGMIGVLFGMGLSLAILSWPNKGAEKDQDSQSRCTLVAEAGLLLAQEIEEEEGRRQQLSLLIVDQERRIQELEGLMGVKSSGTTFKDLIPPSKGLTPSKPSWKIEDLPGRVIDLTPSK
jgi:hypothetical protein